MQDYAQLRHWTNCMRHHGYSELPDPKLGSPQPMGGRSGTVVGWGGAYLAIPQAYDPFSQALQAAANTCGMNPVTSNPRH
jgi:hypothetical protein